MAYSFDAEQIMQQTLDYVKRSQDEVRNIIQIEFAEPYDEYYTGVVSGTSTGWEQFEDVKIAGQKHISAPQLSYHYQGDITGQWYGLSNPEDYQVEAYSFSDNYYHTYTYDLNSDGTWGTWYETITVTDVDGSTFEYEVPHGRVYTGFKEYRLVHKATGEIVDYGYQYIENYRIRLLSGVDSQYTQGWSNVWLPDYRFYGVRMQEGLKIARAIRLTDDEIVGDNQQFQSALIGKVPSSFTVPKNDPQYGHDGSTAKGLYGYKLEDRVFIYDLGLALIMFTLSGDYDRCEEILKRMEYEQNYDGSWNFSYDKFIGKLFHDYVRTGAIGWLGYGICYYMMKSGDMRWLEMAERGADYCLNRQVTDPEDLRYGLLRGGWGGYQMEDYGFIDTEIEWCSTEHNCSTLQYIRSIALLTGKQKYADCARMMEWGLANTLYDPVEKRFYQGVNGGAIDKAWALDCTTWAGLASLSFFGTERADACMNTAIEVYGTSDTVEFNNTKDHFNMTHTSNGEVIYGFKPYSDKTADYEGAPDLVWSEGTLGAVALLRRLGRHEEADFYTEQMVKMLNVEGSTGGLIYTTQTYGTLPWEFHTWESVVGATWLYICLKDVNALWAFHTKMADTYIGKRSGKIVDEKNTHNLEPSMITGVKIKESL